MKTALIALALICQQALAVDWKGNTATLTEQEMAACQAGGGCIVSTRAAVTEVRQVIQMLVDELKAVNDKPAPSCRRDTI